ncbi:MAG: monovalent cation:H+ antiporter-2, family [Archaeoglobi archaeon]|nr:monovalent cation:H+ antiporter-2, family [Archaeoglobi archaeon]
MNFILALLICGIAVLVARKISFPSIPIYLVLGLLLGRCGFNLVQPDEISKFIGEMGLVMLLFYIGLELKKENLLKNKGAIIQSGIIDFILNLPLIYLGAIFLGFSKQEAFIIASALYLSSSAIVLQSLIENRKLIFPESETIVWIMVFEDIMLIPLVLLLSAEGEYLETLNTFLRIFLYLLALFIISRFLRRIEEPLMKLFRRDDEIPLLFGFSLASISIPLQKVLQISEALLAISLGTLLSDIRELEKIIRPFKEVFLVIFFFFFAVSVEISGNFSISHVIVLLLISLLSKFLSGMLCGKIVHRSLHSGIDMGLTILPRGEFSILIASLFATGEISSLIVLVTVFSSVVGSFAPKFYQKG